MELAIKSSACTRRVVGGSVNSTHPALAEFRERFVTVENVESDNSCNPRAPNWFAEFRYRQQD